jgi:Nif-specific regulatory protein
MKPRLVATHGALKTGSVRTIDAETLTIGRSSHNGLVIRDRYVSDCHCIIRRVGNGFSIEDCKSSNGTFVNGAPVTSALLQHGDTVGIGLTKLSFLLSEDPVLSPVHLSDDSEQSLSPENTIVLNVQDSAYLKRDTQTAGARSESKTRNMAVLLAIASKINLIRDSETLQHTLLDSVFEAIPAQRAAILLTGLASDRFISMVGRSGDSATQSEIRVSRTVSMRVLKEGVSLLTNDARSDPLVVSDSIMSAEIQSVICVPLVTFDHTLGVLYADTADPGALFNEEHLHLLTAIANLGAIALEHARYVEWLRCENQLLLEDIHTGNEMVGDHPVMREVHRMIAKVAATNAKVLIRGESGSGKELVARALHLNSKRSGGPFIAINCAAIPRDLLESELFGHEKGAFTEARSLYRGRFEQAHGGTLFLDEIGDMPFELQSKLLRAIERNEFYRLKGTEPIRVDVRLVAATNRPLEEDVKEKRFREDLLYRLRTVTIRIPPLRDRKEDIPRLVAHFVRRFSRECGREVHGLTPDALQVLMQHDWPDNVRGLENAIQYGVIMSDGDRIQVTDLPEELRDIQSDTQKATGGCMSFQDAVTDFKRRLIRKALDESNGTVTKAAHALGLNSNYLHRLMNDLGLRQ